MKNIYNTTANQTGTTYYCGAMVYDQAKNLQYILTDEGRMVPNGTTYHYEYNLKDHLVNVRAVFRTDAAGTGRSLLQETTFYAFGSEIAQLTFNAGAITAAKRRFFHFDVLLHAI